MPGDTPDGGEEYYDNNFDKLKHKPTKTNCMKRVDNGGPSV